MRPCIKNPYAIDLAPIVSCIEKLQTTLDEMIKTRIEKKSKLNNNKKSTLVTPSAPGGASAVRVASVEPEAIANALTQAPKVMTWCVSLSPSATITHSSIAEAAAQFAAQPQLIEKENTARNLNATIEMGSAVIVTKEKPHVLYSVSSAYPGWVESLLHDNQADFSLLYVIFCGHLMLAMKQEKIFLFYLILIIRIKHAFVS
jgi:hypothetical protein